MKYLITILLLTFSNAQAANWFPVGKEGAATVYTKKAKCETAEGQTCFDITNKDRRYHDVQTVQVDDESKPIWKASYNTGACDNPTDCGNEISEADACDEGDQYQYKKNSLLPGYTYYCTKLLGYEQIDVVKLVENPTLKAQVLAADNAKAQAQAAENAVYNHMAFGKKIKARIAVINLTRGLSEAQVKTFVDNFESINRLLDAGAIQTARSSISGLVPDGSLLRQQDKDLILAEIDAFLAQ